MLFFNDQLLEDSAAHIDPRDRGFLLGDGVFETWRCYQGKPFALAAHWQRLQLGLQALGIPSLLSFKRLQEMIDALITANHLADNDCGMRLTISRGPGGRGLSPDPAAQATTLLTSFAIKAASPQSLMLSSYIRCEKSPLSAFKTIAYQENIAANREAQLAGFDDGLLRNTQGQIVSSSRANLFIVSKGYIITPNLESGCLPGVMRQDIIRICQLLDLDYYEGTLWPSDINTASEIFLTNSLLEICPVHHYLNKTFPAPGPVSQALQKALRAHIRGEQPILKTV